MEKSYTHLYNPYDTQIHPVECIGEDFQAENIMKYKIKNSPKFSIINYTHTAHPKVEISDRVAIYSIIVRSNKSSI